MTEHRQLDRLIDDVARRMTDAEPAADMRARVLEAITHLETRTSVLPAWRRWHLVPIAATLAIATATFVIVSRPPSPPASARQAPTPAVAPIETAAANVSPAVNTGASRTEKPAEAPVDPDRDWLDRAVPALGHPELLTMTPIQSDAIEIPEWKIEPIVVPPINAGGSNGGVKL
jgi:hypothetical protein